MVDLHFKTDPPGAKILDSSGLVLGVTPTTIELPKDGREHVLVFRHPDAEDREKRVLATKSRSFEIQLDTSKRVRKPLDPPE